MKSDSEKSRARSRAVNVEGFTRLDLLVVLGVVAVLINLQLPALAGGKGQSKIGLCSSPVRQLALACQLHANDNADRFGCQGMGFAVSRSRRAVAERRANQHLLLPRNGTAIHRPGRLDCVRALQSLEFWRGFRLPYCRLRVGVFRAGQHAEFHQSKYHHAVRNHQDRFHAGVGTSSGFPVLPGSTPPENNGTTIHSGFSKPHVSPHLQGNIPAGGNLGFKDGHVAGRQFEPLVPRTVSGACFWW